MLDKDAVTLIVTHMNEDHADAVLLYAKAFAGREHATSAILVGFDQNGMDIQCTEAGTESNCRVEFEKSLNNASEARQVLVELVNKARTLLKGCD